MYRWLPLLACSAALVAFDARALSPGPPRPVTEGIAPVCSDGQPPDDPLQPCGFNNSCQNEAICIATSGSVVPGAVARGTFTLIVDEDVSGIAGGNDPSPQVQKNDNARLTVLIQFQKDGTPFAVSETYKLTRKESVSPPGVFTIVCDVEGSPTIASLCVPGWQEPATEEVLAQGLQLQWTLTGDEALNSAIVNALFTQAQRDDTSLDDARAVLEVVDPDGVFDHQGTDPLASIARFKVTIRVRP